MSEGLYSIRMRASKGGLHISGAERIIRERDIHAAIGELVERARGHERGVPDSITVTVDSLGDAKPIKLKALPITDAVLSGCAEGRGRAVEALVSAGVSGKAANAALEAITGGAAPGGANMRGAMIMDAATGLRMEPDQARGVRARAVDYDEGFTPGLDNVHIREALALATKVANAPGTVAELCISDDPGYVTGYVASPRHGYVRLTPLKEHGDPLGGRAFFVDAKAFDMEEYIRYLRETPVLVTGPIEVICRHR